MIRTNSGRTVCHPAGLGEKENEKEKITEFNKEWGFCLDLNLDQTLKIIVDTNVGKKETPTASFFNHFFLWLCLDFVVCKQY